MNNRPLNSSLQLLLLFFLLCLGFIANLGSVPLFDEDEGAYSEVTREMLQNNDFVTTRLNGQPFFHKPVMIYWTQAASVSIFGLNEFALRLPSALASMLWAAAIYLFTRRLLGPDRAWYAALFMIVSLQVTIIGKAAIPDALLNLFITMSMFCLYLYYLDQRRRYVYLLFLFMALGFLTKGPIAVLIPVFVSLVFFVVKKKWRSWLKAFCSPVGICIFLLIALPWFVAMYKAHGQAFIDEFFLRQNINRFQTSFEGHSGSVFYYIPVILLGLLPNTAVFIKALSRTRRILSDDLLLFCAAWFVFVLVFFSLAGTKLHHYVVYGYSPLFIIMACFADELKYGFGYYVWPFIFVAALFFLPEIAMFVAPGIDDDFARFVVSSALPSFTAGYKLATGSVALALAVLPFCRTIRPAIKTALTGALFLALLNFLIMPMVGSFQQQPVKEAALLAKKNAYEVVTWRLSYPSFNVYLEKLTADRRPGPGDIFLTKITQLREIGSYEILYQKHGIVMAKKTGD